MEWRRSRWITADRICLLASSGASGGPADRLLPHARRTAGLRSDACLWQINQRLLPLATMAAGTHDPPFVTKIQVPIDDATAMEPRVRTHPGRLLREAERASACASGICEMIPGYLERYRIVSTTLSSVVGIGSIGPYLHQNNHWTVTRP